MSVINILMGILFLAALLLQYNDPDPALWVPIYGLAAVFCLLHHRRRLRPLFPLLLGLGSLFGSLGYALQVIGRMPIWQSEEGREMLGLLLIAGWMTVLTVSGKRSLSEGRQKSSS